MSAHADNLLAAGKRYGDAMLAHERVLYAWQAGDDRSALQAARDACREAENALHRAARAYATRMRRKAKP